MEHKQQENPDLSTAIDISEEDQEQENTKSISDQKAIPNPAVEAEGSMIASSIFWVAIIGVLLVFLAIGFKYFMFDGATSKYKKVDLLTITQNLKDDARKSALKDGVTEAQQGVILENLQKQMNLIDEVLQAEAQKCACTIFVQSAIVADGAKTEDITQVVLDKVRSAK